MGSFQAAAAPKESLVSVNNQLLVYILGLELSLLRLLCCLLSQEPLVASPEPVLPFVRESLGAISCESPPVGNYSCGCIMPGRQNSASLILSLKSTELDVAEHRRLRQDSHEFKSSLASVERPCLKEAGK